MFVIFHVRKYIPAIYIGNDVILIQLHIKTFLSLDS